MVTVTDQLVEKVCYNSQLPWAQDELQRLASSYESGKSIRVVAGLAGVSYLAARRALKLLGVKIRPSNKDKVPKRPRNRSKST